MSKWEETQIATMNDQHQQYLDFVERGLLPVGAAEKGFHALKMFRWCRSAALRQIRLAKEAKRG